MSGNLENMYELYPLQKLHRATETGILQVQHCPFLEIKCVSNPINKHIQCWPYFTHFDMQFSDSSVLHRIHFNMQGCLQSPQVNLRILSSTHKHTKKCFIKFNCNKSSNLSQALSIKICFVTLEISQLDTPQECSSIGVCGPLQWVLSLMIYSGMQVYVSASFSPMAT